MNAYPAARGPRLMVSGILALALLAACSSGSYDSGGADSGVAVDMDAADSGGSEPEAAGPVGQDIGGTQATRQVIVTARTHIEVDDPPASADEVAALVEAADGRVESRSESGRGIEDAGGWAHLVIRVPAGELTALLADLESVGTVRSVEQSQEDVTGAARDLDARIEALETSTARLLEIMASSGSTSDLLATETTLSERQAELESLKSQRAYLADQVALSTLEVELSTTYTAPTTAEREGFLGGLERGWSALVTFVAGLLMVLGWLLPWSPFILVPAALLYWRHRRRKAAGPGDDPPPGAMQPGPPATPAATG